MTPAEVATLWLRCSELNLLSGIRSVISNCDGNEENAVCLTASFVLSGQKSRSSGRSNGVAKHVSM